MKRNLNKFLSLLLCVIMLCSFFPCVGAFAEGDREVKRLAGSNRVITSFLVADQLKETMGVEKFDAVIVASGSTFADALPGSYLSAEKNAPILLTMPTNQSCDQTKQYIRSVLKLGGTVYILGGTNAVKAYMEQGLEEYTIERVAGNNRYLTNLEILKTAGIKQNQEILVCTGLDYADALSASATGCPILLVSGRLTAEQKAYLSTLSGTSFCVLGGPTVVSDAVAAELGKYGTVSRLFGKDRLETSTKVAEKYFKNADSAVAAYSMNFPDGLCGGSLAYAMKAPLILTHSNSAKYGFTAVYTNANGIDKGYVLGGKGILSDAAVQKIFSVDGEQIEPLEKVKGNVKLSKTSEEISLLTDCEIEVLENISGGNLSVMYSDETVATAELLGNVIKVRPGSREGKVVITVTSAATGFFAESSGTCEITVKSGVLEVQAAGYKGVYDGKAHGISVSCEGAEITYAESENGLYSKKNPTYTEAGTYEVFYQVEKDGYTSVLGKENVIIEKADAELNLSAESIDLGYEEAFEMTMAMESDGKLTAKSSDETVAKVSQDGTKLTIKGAEEGAAVITLAVEEGTNHKAAEKTVKVTVKYGDGILTVGENKQYKTIQAAVNAAKNGDVVLVYPGTYEEAVDASTKTIALLGKDRETCILTYPNGDYYNPPLEMASGVLKNMTIIATKQNKVSGAPAKAYCLHTDYNILENNAFCVENVDFVNADYQAVGIGLRGNSTLEFVNCTFTCNGNSNAMFCHDHVAPSKNQRLIARNCTFVNNGNSYTIQLHSQEQQGSTVSVLWENNTVTNRWNGPKRLNMGFNGTYLGSGNWLNTSYWTLHSDSLGNNLNEMNFE